LERLASRILARDFWLPAVPTIELAKDGGGGASVRPARGVRVQRPHLVVI
jgi:hypothetical protein